MDCHYSEYLENENKHLFRNTHEYNQWNDDNFSFTSQELKFLNDISDPMDEQQNRYSPYKPIDNDDCWENFYGTDNINSLYSESDKKTKKKQKSWLINLETKEPELVIKDIDDGEIPEILAEYTWLVELSIDKQEIKEIKNLPPNLKILSLHKNEIKDIPEGALNEGLEKLDISKNEITKLENIPISIIELECEDNEIEICELEKNINLERLIIHKNLITEFPTINSSIIKKINISHNYITKIISLPESLIELDASYNEIIQIIINSPNIKKLNCKGNKLKFVSKYPPNIERINFSRNELVFIPSLPDSLKYAKFNNNNIKGIIINNTAGKFGKLSGNYIIELNNNPLDNVPDYILGNMRIIHNKIINIDYKVIKHTRDIIV